MLIGAFWISRKLLTLYLKEVGARIVYIVSPDGGAVKKRSDVCIIVFVVAQE